MSYGDAIDWRKSIIFSNLVHWATHLLHHNVDVMHTEKNIFYMLLKTLPDIKGKRKDTLNARCELLLLGKSIIIYLKVTGSDIPTACYILNSK